MSQAFEEYIRLRDEMLRIRVEVGHGYYHPAEAPLLEAMDRLWSQMEKAEIVYIKDQGAWRFADVIPSAGLDRSRLDP